MQINKLYILGTCVTKKKKKRNLKPTKRIDYELKSFDQGIYPKSL